MSFPTSHHTCSDLLWKSQVGRKFLVATTGVILVLFILGHLAGNLAFFAGSQAFNAYAEFLHHVLHGAGIWMARAFLLAALVIHIAAAVSLTRENRQRNVKNVYPGTIQATTSSLTMIWTGLMILAFLIFHLLHFTIRSRAPEGALLDQVFLEETGLHRFDAWMMVFLAFRNFWAVLVYTIAMVLLAAHVRHGFQSMIQTFGLRSHKTAKGLDKLSVGVALFVLIGFLSIPYSVFLFGFGK